MSDDIFNKIKKQNGEGFAKAIREYDNGIFDIPNIVSVVKYAGNDARPLLNYLEALKDVKIEESSGEVPSPLVLLDKAGYNAEYADTLEKQNSIQKYFEPNEKLCTFNDYFRFQRYYIVNAVKKNIDAIKRENFQNPMREDEYGTSVISIQILKTGGFISIKNRYNSTVSSPDNTFSSNPDNIIAGLGQALQKYFNVDFSAQAAELPNRFTVANNKIVKYNYEINNVYFGKNFYMKNGEIAVMPSHHIMMDYFIYDNKNQEIIDVAGLGISVDDREKMVIQSLARTREQFSYVRNYDERKLNLHELVDIQLQLFNVKFQEAGLIIQIILNNENKKALGHAYKQLVQNELYDFISGLPEKFPNEKYAQDLKQHGLPRESANIVAHYINELDIAK